MTTKSKLRVALTVAVLGSSIAFGDGRAFAQSVPSKEDQEMLVKTTLLTLNDADLTGDYSVLHAKLSKPFRDQFDAEKLKDGFKDFVGKQLDMSVVAVKSTIPDTDGSIDKDGVLELSGSFDTKPKVLKYKLQYIRSDGAWKPLGIHVSTE
jgi:hypothetical protein